MSTELKSVYGVKRTSVHYTDDNCINILTESLLDKINNSKKKFDKIVLFCIGTDRSTGDSLGPLLGTLLENKVSGMFEIMGTLEEPVHAKNLVEKYESIENKENKLIIAIDACLGKSENIGNIKITNGSLVPGAAMNKDLPNVGDISIAGIVNCSGTLEFMTLQNTRLNIVWNMAKKVEQTLDNVMNAINNEYDTNRDYEQITLFA